MRLLIALLLTTLASAQTATRYEIRGTVVEPGVGPISGATVTSNKIDETKPVTAVTNDRGEFVLALDGPGTYLPIAQKDGYFVDTLFPGAAGIRQVPTLNASTPNATLILTLMREGKLSGRVLDEETRQPLSGVDLTAHLRTWSFGRPQLSRVNTMGLRTTTDADGRFTFSGLRPGDYVVTAHPQPDFLVPNPSKADLEKIDQVYAETYWPGGSSLESARPAQLTSGGFPDLGSIFVHKVPSYRVHVKLEGACTSEEQVKLSILKPGDLPANVGTFPCGADLLLRGFDPGAYALYAVSRAQGGRQDMEAAVWGSLRIDITDKNLDVTVPLQHGFIIHGEISMASGASDSPLAASPSISIRPRDLDALPGARPEAETFVRWDDNHHFVLALPPGPLGITVRPSNIIGAASLQELRFNGSPVRNGIIRADTASPASKLEIIFTDQGTSVSGTITDSNAVPAVGITMMVPDSATAQDLRDGFSMSTGSSFRIYSPSPGAYRIFAVPLAQRELIDQPGVIERLLSSAQKLTVAPGSTQVLTVKLTELR